jgi:hypothetical protein
LERKLRLETTEADKALERCATLAAARERVNVALEAKCAELEDSHANNTETDKELRRLRTQVKHLEKELWRKGDDMKALTTKATLGETALNRKLAHAEGRVEKYKGEAKDFERRIESLVQEVKEQRKTNESLQKKLGSLQNDVVDQKQKAKMAAAQCESLLNRSQQKAIAIECERDTSVAELFGLKEERIERIEIREGGVRGNPVNEKFMRHARALLASSGSAPATLKQLSLNARFFLSDADYDHFIHDMPSLRWIQYQREGLGLESYLYTLTRIAKCDRVLQWGFDETSLDGVVTMNQWVRIKEGGDFHILTLKCAGLLVGSTASKVAEHVRLFWQQGQEAIAMLLREELGDLADEYVPLVNGGVGLSKLGSVI